MNIRSLPMTAMVGIIGSLATATASAGILFQDDFTGQSAGAGTPTNFAFVSPATLLGAEDTFKVVDNGSGNEVLRYVDQSPTSVAARTFYTTSTFDFASTNSKILRFEATMTITDPAEQYRIGIYKDGVLAGDAMSESAYQFRFFPNNPSGNVNLLTFHSSAGVAINNSGTASQSLLTGTHTFMLEVDFTLSDTTPVVNAYSNGTLLYSITATTGGFDRADASGLQFMFRSGQNGNGAAFDVDNVKVSYQDVPEPASLGLMTLGGLMLLSKRR